MWNNSSGSEPNLKINKESDFYLKSYEIKVVEVETCTPPRKAGLTFCQNIALEFTGFHYRGYMTRHMCQQTLSYFDTPPQWLRSEVTLDTKPL